MGYNARNRVYSNLKKKISNVDILVSRTQKIAKDKTIFFVMLGNREVAQDLEGDTENVNLLTFQIETFAKDLTDAYDLMDEVVKVMKSMYFEKADMQLLENTLDTNYMRVVCKFSRLVGSGEEIEKL